MSGNGLVMSGEASINLNPGNNVMSESLKVKRVVAKVKLGNVVIAPVEGHTGTFELESVMIMKAKGLATYGPGSITTSTPWHGGMVGTVTTNENIHLSESLTNSDNKGRLFYVFPNDNTGGNATLLTVKGKYNGEDRYFPVRINDGTGLAGSTTDGTFITRNHVYTINMTIKRPNDGSVDPEIPVDPATLELTVEVDPWEAELVQNIEF